MAIIRTMKGAKSNFHIRAINMKPNCKLRKKESVNFYNNDFRYRTTKIFNTLTTIRMVIETA